ncbi:MAG TPA: TetR family transcriptional regulator [Ktedonobacteraceae bacterium]|nr:TetR family transcriptional regulator [Ktedonobacteraceae bacterium]
MTQTTRNKHTRRAELLKAAREIFAEKGYAATTISEIVARAGVAQGTFYLYFPSKVLLVIALAEEIQEQIKTAISEAYAVAEHPGELIDTSVRAAFEIMGRYRDVLGIIHSGVYWTEAPNERERIFAPYYALIADLIRQQQVRGTISPTINPPITAMLIVGLVFYSADECYLYNQTSNPEAYISETIRFIRRALGVS